MDNTIILLDDHTINQIAAGEVIEAPADVIKELVENSLDAEATQIHIAIDNGGLDKIKIIDNGFGIPKDSIKKAFMRHGTSKLNTIDDLYRLETMGFRGEALASIASISEMILSSKIIGEAEGYVYRIKGGKDSDIQPIAMTEGTHIVIKNLFYNAPVRQKFLSSLTKETRKAIAIVEKLAMARPDVSFELVSDERIVLKTLGNDALREVATTVFSLGTAEKMKTIYAETDAISIEGLVGARDQYRGSRDYQHFFINRRYVKSKGLSQALERAYKNILPQKKYPIAILHLTIPTYEVEVNIHPRKLEVKIENQKRIEDLLEEAVKKVLYEKEKIATPIKEAVPYEAKETIEVKDEISFEEKEVKGVLENKPGYTYVYLEPQLGNDENDLTQKESHPLKKVVAYPIKEEAQPANEEQITLTLAGDVKIAEQKNPFEEVSILGNVSDTYLIGVLEDTLYLFDQHACHERIRFEKIREQFKKEGFKSQLLLEPELIEVGQSDYLKIVEHIMDLETYGVFLEVFGQNGFTLRGLPLSMSVREAGKAFLLELVDKIENKDLEMIDDYMIEKAACVGSVKAWDTLTESEGKSLLRQLGECEFPYTCPHGRPTMIKWTANDLEKLFLRS